MLGIPFRYLLRHPWAAKELLAHPVQTCVLVVDAYIATQEQKQSVPVYGWNSDWELKLHQHLAAPWPCAFAQDFCGTYEQVIAELEASGIKAGPESFARWNDGDAALCRALWCLVRHTKPERVVETGVAHGTTSRIILEAMERNRVGHLWSIDLPPIEKHLRDQVGIAVRGMASRRWSYLKGSSRVRLPDLLSSLQTIDLFIHDSLHSERNVRFELDLAWPVLRPGGAIVVDDVDANAGFRCFTALHAGQPSLIGEAEPVRPDTRRFNQRGLFGVVLKRPVPLKRVA